MALRGFEHLNLPAARHPRRFYRVQHSNSYTSQDEVTGEFHAEGRLTQGSARCLPHFLKRINLVRQVNGTSHWAGLETPYISVFYKRGKKDLSTSSPMSFTMARCAFPCFDICHMSQVATRHTNLVFRSKSEETKFGPTPLRNTNKAQNMG